MRGSDFIALQAFAAVAERRSFARAAEHLRIAPSTLSQLVRGFEERLDLTLLHRTTRSVALTSAGSRLLAGFAPALQEMEAALLDAREQRATPRGVVRLHAPAPACDRHIVPRLGGLREALPEVVLDLTIDDGLADAAASGYDLVIRRAEFVDTALVAHDLGGDLRHAVVASPGYLAAHGEPESPHALGAHRCIRWRRPATSAIDGWRFEVDGDPVLIAVEGPLVVSHCEAAVAAACQGVGLAYVLRSYVDAPIAGGSLRPLLTGFLPRFDGWRICLSRQARPSAATLAVLDLLRQHQHEAVAANGSPPG